MTTSRTHFALSSVFAGIALANVPVTTDWGGAFVVLMLGLLSGFNLGLGLARSEVKP